MIGRARSSSLNPIALSMPRAAARSGPSVSAALWRLSGLLGRSYGRGRGASGMGHLRGAKAGVFGSPSSLGLHAGSASGGSTDAASPDFGDHAEVNESHALTDRLAWGAATVRGLARRFAGRSRWELLRNSVLAVLSGFGLFMTILIFQAGMAKGGAGFDALCYWSIKLSNPYGGQYGGVNFAYAPPLALAF